MEAVYTNLNVSHPLDALYLRYLYFTGMRFNEGLAISVGDLFQGEIENEFMKKKLAAYEISYHGYVVSDGQFGHIDPGGGVVRVPFKGQKKIQEKSNRIVPIIDKTLWNSMVDLAQAISQPDKKPRDTLLFELIDDTTFSRRLKEAFISAKLRYREPHCLRHSRATLLIGQTADLMLARIWIGHTSPRTIEKYNHIYQAVTRQAKAKAMAGAKGLRRV